MSLVSLQHGNVKKSKKSMKVANIDRENLDISEPFEELQWNFSGKMLLMIILKVTLNQGFTLSLEDAFYEKQQGRLYLHYQYLSKPLCWSIFSLKLESITAT